VRLADHDRSGRAQPRDDVGVGELRRTERVGSPRSHLSRDVCVVLDRDGDPEQRAVLPRGVERVRLIRFGPGAIGKDDAVCVEARVQCVDPLEGRLDELVMLSLGTGHSLQHIEGPSHNWGYVQWIRPLIDLMLDGVNGIADYQCRQILRDRYCRFAPTFPPDKNIGMDAVDQIPYMVDFAERLDLSEVANWLIANW